MADAQATWEAVQRPTTRFVPIKSADKQAALLLHRARELLIRQRGSLISAIRAHFAELAIVAGQRIRNVERLLELLDRATDARLPMLARAMLGVLARQLRESPHVYRRLRGNCLPGTRRTKRAGG